MHEPPRKVNSTNFVGGEFSEVYLQDPAYRRLSEAQGALLPSCAGLVMVRYPGGYTTGY
jgi:hypothetical protein